MELNIDDISNLFKEKVIGLREEPEFQWSRDRVTYASDSSGEPVIKMAAVNMPLTYDLWAGLRNPAVIGLYPVGFRELWEFHANRTKKRVDEFGRQTIFKVSREYEYALDNYNRAIIISVMLPFSQNIIESYSKIISDRDNGSSHIYRRMYEDVNSMIDKATGRVAIDLISEERVVISMDNRTVENISKEAVPLTHQGDSHGPSKGCNYPQKSIAVITGLGQFGVAKFVFRDEIVNNRVERFVGPLRSIIIFDKQEPVIDGSGGLRFPTEEWRKFLFKLSDFSEVEPDINKYRFCTYIPYNDSGCGKCIEKCPSGAQLNSAPSPNGDYFPQIKKQQHRFWDGKLQFDYARCCDDRGQMAGLFPEWSCTRCLSICAAEGVKRRFAAENHSEIIDKLTHE